LSLGAKALDERASGHAGFAGDCLESEIGGAHTLHDAISGREDVVVGDFAWARRHNREG